jgi:hypothetical protein
MKKRSKAPKRKRAAPSRRKRASGRGLVIKVTVPAVVPLQGPELGPLTPSQRLELASLGTKKSYNAPGWVADEKLWRSAVRQVAPRWKRYEYPFAAVAYVYLRTGGLPRGFDPGGSFERTARAEREAPPRSYGARMQRGAAPLVERVQLDELGYDDFGKYWGAGEPLWRVQSEEPYIDTHVRARTAAAAKREVMERFQH